MDTGRYHHIYEGFDTDVAIRLGNKKMNLTADEIVYIDKMEKKIRTLAKLLVERSKDP